MEPHAIVELLGKSALFGSLAETDLTAIAGRMRRVQFDADQMIFSRGDAGREIYLVLEGKIRLSILSSDGRELSFAHAGPGSIFGEIATLDGGERTAGATAITRVTAMALPQRATMGLIENNPKVAMATIRFLCTRLRETDQRLEAIALHRIEVRLARLPMYFSSKKAQDKLGYAPGPVASALADAVEEALSPNRKGEA